MTWVEPAERFFDRIDATDQRLESSPSGRVNALILFSSVGRPENAANLSLTRG